MKTRSIKPILEFVRTASTDTYYIDTQFGEIHYVSNNIAANVSVRIDACGDVYIIEIDEDNTELCNERKE